MTPTILYLIDLVTWRGGTENHLKDLALRLPSHGFHPIICSLNGEEPMLSELAEMGIETWPRQVRRVYAPDGRAVVGRIVREAQSRNVQVVQTFHFKSDWAGVSVAKALGCPLVSSRRDLGYHRRPSHHLVYRWISRFPAAFIAPSQAVARAATAMDRIPAGRMHVIYNGLDTERYASPPSRSEARSFLGVPPSGPVIGMVSRLHPIKDQPTLIRAFRRLAERFSDATLVLVGKGPREDEVRALVSGLGLESRVVFAGECFDVPRALAAMDVFVLATHSEGMSNAILEAMAAGLPVVATDVGGNAECVEHGNTGFIVPDSDEAAMADCLFELLSNPDEAARMGRAGRARVVEHFDIGAMVRRTAELYRSLGAAEVLRA